MATYNSPFPFLYNAPPSYPYADTSPAPAAISFPAPEYGHSAFSLADTACSAVQPALTEEHLRSAQSMPSDLTCFPTTPTPRTNLTSFDTIQGEMSRLSEAVARLASSLGIQTTEAPVIGSSPAVASTQFISPATTASMLYGMGAATSSSVSSLSYPSDASATSYVLPQMFSEMPQSYGFHNLNRKSIIRADGSEHSYFTLPEDYSLEKATPQISPSADGKNGVTAPLSVAAEAVGPSPVLCSKANNTAGSQSMLSHDQQLPMIVQNLSRIPETCPFVRATPQPVFDVYDDESESVHVFASPPERQSYEEEQQERGQIPKCVSKESEIAVPSQQPPIYATATDQMQFQASESMPNYDVYEKEDSACINIISGVRDFTPERQQQDGERACNCPVLKASDSVVNRSSQLGVDHSMSKLRLLWDPGPSAFLATVLNNSSKDTMGNEHTGLLVSSTGDLSFHDKTDVLFRSEHQLIVLRGVFDEAMLVIPPAPPESISSAQHIPDPPMKKSNIFSARRTLLWNPWYEILLLHHCVWEFSNSSMECVPWDPGVKVSLYCWLNILTVGSETLKPLSCTHVPELATWQNQAISASYVWDTGTILWYTSTWLVLFTISDSIYAYFLAVRHCNGRSIHCIEKIMYYFTVSSVLEEKEMLNGPSPRSWSSVFQQMQAYVQKCNSLSIQLYTHQGISLYGIPLWLINFQVP